MGTTAGLAEHGVVRAAPAPAWEALQAVLQDWHVGATSWEPWDESTTRARQSFARLMGAEASDVFVGSTVSAAVAPIRPGINLVAVSAVQAATGTVLDLAEVIAASNEIGALLVVDASQAAGWLPLDVSGIDALITHTYKWLMSPRGATLGYLSPRLQERCRPLHAGWYAGQDVKSSYYGTKMELARDARRFDQSPAWFSFVGAAPVLELIEQIGIDAIHQHDIELANEFRAGLEMPPGNSAIVSADIPGGEQAFAAAGVRAAVRGGKLRAAFHVYSTSADVQLALDALDGLGAENT